MTLDTTHAGTIWIAYDDERFAEVFRTVDEAGVLLDLWLENPLKHEATKWTAAELAERGIVQKCIDCDEGRGTCPGGRCRDCDIDACRPRR